MGCGSSAAVYQAPLDQASKVPTNSAVLFIKPHAVTQAVQDLVKARLTSASIKVVKSGCIYADTIDKQGLIDNHYGAIASRALKESPKDLLVSESARQDFEALFGLSWGDALSQGLVFNAAEACDKLGIDPLALGELSGKTKRGESQVKFGGGFYVSKILDVYVVNGFYAELRSRFTRPASCIVYYEVQWDPAALSWANFRGNVVGATNPNDAAAGSIRNLVLTQWQSLGLGWQPNTGENGIHASASPFEGLVEKANWLGAKATEDSLGQALIAKGVKQDLLLEWMAGADVMYEGKKTPLFDVLEDLDFTPCVERAAKIASGK